MALFACRTCADGHGTSVYGNTIRLIVILCISSCLAKAVARPCRHVSQTLPTCFPDLAVAVAGLGIGSGQTIVLSGVRTHVQGSLVRPEAIPTPPPPGYPPSPAHHHSAPCNETCSECHGEGLNLSLHKRLATHFPAVGRILPKFAIGGGLGNGIKCPLSRSGQTSAESILNFMWPLDSCGHRNRLPEGK